MATIDVFGTVLEETRDNPILPGYPPAKTKRTWSDIFGLALVNGWLKARGLRWPPNDDTGDDDAEST